MDLWSLGPINQDKEYEYKWNKEQVLNPNPLHCIVGALPVKGHRAAVEKGWQKTPGTTAWAKE